MTRGVSRGFFVGFDVLFYHWLLHFQDTVHALTLDFEGINPCSDAVCSNRSSSLYISHIVKGSDPSLELNRLLPLPRW